MVEMDQLLQMQEHMEEVVVAEVLVVSVLQVLQTQMQL
jgi:hypothetical protein